VSHFTVWNADMPLITSYVTGCVTSGAGHAVGGARVTVEGLNWRSVDSSTASDGCFRIPVASERAASIWAAKNGSTSERIAFTTAATGLEYDVGDLILGVPPIKIALTWGSEPYDLDAHLTFPGSLGREHVYYSNKIVEGQAFLDTDDTSSYGPEIITVQSLNDGVYRYSVHHYSGSATISTSNALVTMTIDGLGTYVSTPPSGAAGSGDVWHVWDVTVSGGEVVRVDVLDDYLNDVSSSDVASFSP